MAQIHDTGGHRLLRPIRLYRHEISGYLSITARQVHRRRLP